jgi:ABC-2 type transport system ATP-binding protein
MRLVLEGVTRRFGRVYALRDLDLTLESGTKAALIGPNGSGKSTLTRALMGLVTCQGLVHIDGMTPSRHRVALARRMAYVPQIAPRFAAAAGEIVGAVAGVRGLDPSAVWSIAERLELDARAVTGRPFQDLSGGMKQKLLIAIALAAPVDLLILDEPTASLDPRARELFYGLYHERAGAATTLLCSHRIEEVRHLVDHIVALEDGRVVYQGAADVFLARRAVSVIELKVPRPNGHTEWLHDAGFAPGLPGWWVKRARQDEKVAVLASLPGRLGAALENVLVRDLESVDDGGRRGGEGETS